MRIFNKNGEVQMMLEDNGHIILFLPQYSSFLSPIENMILKLNQQIKTERPNNETRLFELIDNVNLIVWVMIMLDLFQLVFSFLPKVLKRV